MTQPRLITPDDAGCWFSGSASRSADELNQAVIDAALDQGMPMEADLRAEYDAVEWEGSWCADSDDSQWLSELGTEACDYLNSLAPDGYVFYFDDGFYLSAVCDTESYEPQFDECPHAERNCPIRAKGYAK
jgi:hypothetical protein